VSNPLSSGSGHDLDKLSNSVAATVLGGLSRLAQLLQWQVRHRVPGRWRQAPWWQSCLRLSGTRSSGLAASGGRRYPGRDAAWIRPGVGRVSLGYLPAPIASGEGHLLQLGLCQPISSPPRCGEIEPDQSDQGGPSYSRPLDWCR
jgi:hypothetical protein